MSIKKTITAGAVTVLMLTLTTACSGGSIQQQQVPSETDAPSVSATAEPTETAAPAETPAPGSSTDNEFGFDVSSVTIPEDVTAAYGAEALSTLVPRALTITSISYNEISQLHEARADGSQDALFLTGALGEYLTPDALALLVSTPGEGDSAGLVPTVDPDGTILGGQAEAPGISAVLRGAPVVSLYTGADAAGQQVQVTVPVQATAYRVGEDAVVNTDLRLYFVPDASGSWLLAAWGWDTTAVSGL